MSKQNWRQALEEKERREREREEQARLEKQKKLEQLKSELQSESKKEQEEVIVPELGLVDIDERLKAEEERLKRTFSSRGVVLPDTIPKPKPELTKTESKIQLRDISENSAKTILKNQWLGQTQDSSSMDSVKCVKQIKPTKDLIQRFESRRTELEILYPGKPLNTKWAYLASNKERLDGYLNNGFPEDMTKENVTFHYDPKEAIPFATDKIMILCRIALGKEGDDYTKSGEKYSLKYGSNIMPTWYIELK